MESDDSDGQSSDQSPPKKFKSSFMNNVETVSPDGRHRDTQNVDLDLDLDLEVSDGSEDDMRLDLKERLKQESPENLRKQKKKKGEKNFAQKIASNIAAGFKSGVGKGIELLQLNKLGIGESRKDKLLNEDRPGKFNISSMMKVKNKLMKNTKKKRIKPWNFMEYY